jgi:hypothetical protein
MAQVFKDTQPNQNQQLWDYTPGKHRETRWEKMKPRKETNRKKEHPTKMMSDRKK